MRLSNFCNTLNLCILKIAHPQLTGQIYRIVVEFSSSGMVFFIAASVFSPHIEAENGVHALIATQT